MASIVQSRFAGLNIEDDDFPPTANRKKTKNAQVVTKKPDSQKKNKKTVLGNATSNVNGASKKKNKNPCATEEQWEQWKQKDEEMVTGAYEAELTQAILLSKLEYEEQKAVIKQSKKQNEAEKKLAEQVISAKENKSQKKQKKKNVMSLEQFNDMVSGEEPKRAEEPPECDNEPLSRGDSEFFERAHDEAQLELRRDKYKESVIQRQPPSDDIINRVQFAEALERKDKEIDKLTEEVSRLKEELLTVKTRNKKLCNILGQGEMRDKAEALVELEKLRQVQSELTAEVASLHAQLEQERSRHPDPRNKDKKKKEK